MYGIFRLQKWESQKFLRFHGIASLARFPRFCWVWNCARVLLAEVQCFADISKSYVILEVFLWALNCFVVVACAGALFYENLVLPCVFSIDFEGWQVHCSYYARRHNVWRRHGTFKTLCMIHHYCALLKILRGPGEAGFTDSLVAHLDNWDAHFGEWRIMWFTNERFYVQFPESI